MALMDKLLCGIFKGMEKKNPRPEVKRREGVYRILDKPFMTKDGSTLKMDIYMPGWNHRDNAGDSSGEKSEKLPVVIAVHGGGFFIGSKEYYDQAGEDLASRGYLVYAVDYRHIPEVRVYEDISDVCDAMNDIADHLEEYNGDLERIYVTGESAGAYLATYVHALENSAELRDIVGSEAPRLKVRAMALNCGMYYTNQKSFGNGMNSSMYAGGERAKRFKPYRNPEHPDVIGNFPPTIMVTSDADFLKGDSYNYSKALVSRGVDSCVINLGPDKRLDHAFTVMHPDYPESEIALDYADKWFKEH